MKTDKIVVVGYVLWVLLIIALAILSPRTVIIPTQNVPEIDKHALKPKPVLNTEKSPARKAIAKKITVSSPMPINKASINKASINKELEKAYELVEQAQEVNKQLAAELVQCRVALDNISKNEDTTPRQNFSLDKDEEEWELLQGNAIDHNRYIGRKLWEGMSQ